MKIYKFLTNVVKHDHGNEEKHNTRHQCCLGDTDLLYCNVVNLKTQLKNRSHLYRTYGKGKTHQAMGSRSDLLGTKYRENTIGESVKVPQTRPPLPTASSRLIFNVCGIQTV